MTRIMYDTINTSIGDIPASPEMVAGYVDGLYAWSDADWRRFPDAVKVRIAVFANTDDGHVLDVENGDATPQQAPSWVQRRRSAGLLTPTVYCNTETWPYVQGQFAAQRVAPPLYWIARYDGVAAIPDGAIAKQYLNFETPVNYDQSIVADYWPGVDPMALSQQDLIDIFNFQIPRQGAGETGPTSLAGLVGWNDAHVQGIVNKLNAQQTLLEQIAQKLGIAP